MLAEMTKTHFSGLRQKVVLGRVGTGLVMGGLAGLSIEVLNLNVLIRSYNHTILTMTILGGLLGLTRWRKLLLPLCALLLIMILVIGYSPITTLMARSVPPPDPLQPSDAIVVLAGGYIDGSTIAAEGQDRLLKGLELLHAGMAPRLLVTQPTGDAGQWIALVKAEMKGLGIAGDVEPVGPVVNTHDESLMVARMAREHGWRRIILVTQSWHMRRAAALFTKAGLDVLRCPCGDSTYDSRNPQSPGDRLTAFRDWLHETVGYEVYHLRGWL